MVEYQISKIDGAVEQLDWAIRLFLDHQAYVPSITLAGASEELLGKSLSDPERSSFAILKKELPLKYTVPDGKSVSQDYLNKARNFLKHCDKLTDQETISLDCEEEATQYILRALANLVAYDRSIPSEAPRFIAWLSQHRSDLAEMTRAMAEFVYSSGRTVKQQPDQSLS